MYKLIFVGYILLIHSIAGLGQKVQNSNFEKELTTLLDHSVHEITVQDLASDTTTYILLDAREYEEYEVSHIPNARHIGYDKIKWNVLSQIDKGQNIIVYCSVGYRSEKVTEKLEKRGFENVSNLYGSIFEWANCNLPLEDINGNSTDTIHTYNKKWSQWVDNPSITKTW